MTYSFACTFRSFLCLAVLVPATACSLQEPTWVNSSRVEVHEEGFTDRFDTASLDKGTLRAIGVNYYRYGNGPMDISVSYDPRSGTNTAAAASREAGRIRDELSRNGVKSIRISTAGSEGSGDKSSTVISFPALTARPPENCGTMPGYSDLQTNLPDSAEGPSKGYEIGCTIETMMAKQVSRPGDLLGRPGFETDADARRQEAVIWQRGYYANKPFEPLNGERATDDD